MASWASPLPTAGTGLVPRPRRSRQRQALPSAQSHPVHLMEGKIRVYEKLDPPGHRPRRTLRVAALPMSLIAGAGLVASPAHAVVGGDTGAYPAVVQVATASHACSGVLVDSSWILTAGTCVAAAGQTSGNPVEPTT